VQVRPSLPGALILGQRIIERPFLRQSGTPHRAGRSNFPAQPLRHHHPPSRDHRLFRV